MKIQKNILGLLVAVGALVVFSAGTSFAATCVDKQLSEAVSYMNCRAKAEVQGADGGECAAKFAKKAKSMNKACSDQGGADIEGIEGFVKANSADLVSGLEFGQWSAGNDNTPFDGAFDGSSGYRLKPCFFIPIKLTPGPCSFIDNEGRKISCAFCDIELRSDGQCKTYKAIVSASGCFIRDNNNKGELETIIEE
jgi:hypothetical protein